MKSLILLLPFALAAGCHTGPSLGPAPLRVSFGEFHFLEHPPGISTPFEGTVSLTGDEIEVDSKDIGCFTVVTNDPKAQAFRCGDYSIRAQKIADGWEFFYATTREVEERHKVCDSYKTSPTGQQVCVSTREEVRIRTIPVNGRIRLNPQAMAGLTP